MVDKERFEEVRLISGNANLPLAQRIAKLLGVGLCEADKPSKNGPSYGPGRFLDGEVRVQVQQTVRGCCVFVIQPLSPPVNDHLMELLVMVDALHRASAEHICAVVPYLGYARQDRKMTGRVPISARLVADLLETAGADRVLTMDLHAGQIQGFFKIPVDHLRSDRLFAEYIFRKHPDWLENLTVVSPDLGGVWRANRMVHRLQELRTDKKFKLAVVVMQRDEVKKEIVVDDVIGPVAGKDVLIVDDILGSGGTLLEAARELKEEKAKRIFAACTHGVFSPGALENLGQRELHTVLVTDTIHHRDEVRRHPKVEIVSVAELFADAIRRISSHKSMTDLLVRTDEPRREKP